MLERKFRHNYVLILILLMCISVWHIHINNAVNFIPISSEVNDTATYAALSTNSSYLYSKKMLPLSDYTALMNLSNFKFRILNVCTSSPGLVIVIHTAPNNYKRRKSIRETWGHKRHDGRLFFMLGSVKDNELQKKLEDENVKHKDIVQGLFVDAYTNVTYKHAMTFKFVIYHCSQAKYILKTDDDVFVNMPTMMDFLTLHLPPNGAEKLLSCSEQKKAPVKRSYRSKWRVSFSDYNKTYYPPYCPGWVILYSPDVVFNLYQQVQQTKYFWIDDVLITGILRDKENIQITNAKSVILPYEKMKNMFEHKIFYNSTPTFLYGPPNLSPQDIYTLNNLIKNNSNYNSLVNFVR